MTRIKMLKGWGIFQNNPDELEFYGFRYTVLTPDNMECRYICCPGDSDIECNSVDEAVSWIRNY